MVKSVEYDYESPLSFSLYGNFNRSFTVIWLCTEIKSRIIVPVLQQIILEKSTIFAWKPCIVTF